MKNFTLIHLVLCIFFIFFANCTQTVKTVNTEKEKDTGIREIEILSSMSNSQKINLSAVASSIDYCLLETNKQCLVVPLMSIYCSKKYIVTLGRQTDNHYVCYVFERGTGRFVRQISRMGQGPNDYQYVDIDFWDAINEQICVYCNNQYAFYNLDCKYRSIPPHKKPKKSD